MFTDLSPENTSTPAPSSGSSTGESPPGAPIRPSDRTTLSGADENRNPEADVPTEQPQGSDQGEKLKE